MCENTQGGYSCICDSGYELAPDGAFCLGKISIPLPWEAVLYRPADQVMYQWFTSNQDKYEQHY